MIKQRIFFILQFICVLLLSSVSYGDLKDKVILTNVIDKIRTYHFDPKPVDDKLSKDIFSLYIKRLDPGRQFFLQRDIDKLKEYELLLDDQLLQGGYSFQLLANHFLDRQIKEVTGFYETLLSQPFDFFTNESITVNIELAGYSESPEVLKKRWKKLLKYQALTNYMTLVAGDKEVSNNPKVLHPKLEKKARKMVVDSTKRLFERMGKETEEEKFARYLDAVSNIFDPHTSYLLPSKKEDFDISISGKLEGIGAVLREEDGNIKVVRIVSGSASWRQKELEAEDIIIKVGQGDEASVSIEGARVRDAVKLIRGKKGTEVRLTVKKPDGQIKVISIIRDIVIIEETYAKSAVINHKKLNKRFGYILLPSFYRDFKDRYGRNSTDDVRKELEYLNEQGIDGIILDLRNNGGGALDDAVKMAGLFIRSGPIVQVKNKINRGRVLSDIDQSIIYDGPLVILLNSFSASASEILAAALQDYGRAVIVGSTSSYGKGTVQTFLDLDKYIPSQFRSLRPFGSLKLTIQKFYRVNGESTQYKGVHPDILLPFSTDHIKAGEKTLDHSLSWTTVNAVSYGMSRDLDLNIDLLKNNSQARVDKETYFDSVKAYVDVKEKRIEKKKESLNLLTRLEEKEKMKKENKAYKIKAPELPYLLIPTPNNILGPDKEQKVKNLSDWFKQIKKDRYIDESMFVLNDMIK